MIAVAKGLFEDIMMKYIFNSLECRTDIDKVCITSTGGEIFISSNIVFYSTFLIAKAYDSVEFHIKYSNICAMEFIIEEDEND